MMDKELDWAFHSWMMDDINHQDINKNNNKMILQSSSSSTIGPESSIINHDDDDQSWIEKVTTITYTIKQKRKYHPSSKEDVSLQKKLKVQQPQYSTTSSSYQ